MGPATTFPVTASHTRIVLSEKPEAIRVPLGEKATQLTPAARSFRGPKATFPFCTSRTMSVWSSEPEAMHFPSGENTAHQTQSVCPRNVRLGVKVTGFGGLASTGILATEGV